jgi:DNA-binding GntR family transcriptional regulator
LLATRVDSFEKLELIVALHAAPRSTLSIDALARQLRLPREVVREAAVALRAATLVELTSDGEVQLLPVTNRDHEAVAELVRVYKEDRIAVVTEMGEIALDRIRNLASRAFSDAFDTRRKK